MHPEICDGLEPPSQICSSAPTLSSASPIFSP
jgi:hypothetical protein